ncbi:MAG: YwaF family protein [Clostridia bacterium]|nr:YwaF family protein [Clostridia bacterium]
MNKVTFYDWLTKSYEGKVAPGGGLWCNMHFILLGLLVIWLVVITIVFIKNKTFARSFCYVLCFIMIVSRLLRMAIQLSVMGYSFLEILPWQLCHLLAFVLPIYYFTKCKFFSTPILMLAFFGGILTFLFGDYYQFARFSFLDLESILLHFMLPTIAIGSIVGGRLQFAPKKIWQLLIALAVLFGYASFSNWLLPGNNYMYIEENGLPFNIFPGVTHLLTYAVVAVVLVCLFMLPFALATMFKRRKHNVE